MALREPRRLSVHTLKMGAVSFGVFWLTTALGLAAADANGAASFSDRRAASAPSIAFQPSSQVTNVGSQAHFTVIATGEPPLTYQWRKNGVDLSDGGPISGATSDVLMLSALTMSAAAGYSVVVRNASGSETSVEATLTLTIPQGGDVDWSFNAGSSIDGAVTAINLQPDTKVLIGGSFTSVSGAARGRIARLYANGTTDHTFGSGTTGANDQVTSIAVQSDGRVLIGGLFSTVNGVSRNRIARLNVDGSLDTTFLDGLTGANSQVTGLAVQPDGHVLIGGSFNTVNGVSRNRIARLNADGSLDSSFLDGLSGVSGGVEVLLLQPDGLVVIGGNFTAVNGVSRNCIARLNTDGSVDTTFINVTFGPNSQIRALALQPDGRLLVGGSFSTINGSSRNRIARLNADGSLDTTFLNGLPGANGTVISVALRSSGELFIGGSFTTVNGVSRNLIAGLTPDGNLDASFSSELAATNPVAQFTNLVSVLAVQPDGRVLLGGNFGRNDGASPNYITRVSSVGVIDPTFQNGAAATDGGFSCVAVQPDGRILVGGTFSTVQGTQRRNLARLNRDGTLDTTFLNGLSGPNGGVESLALQPDGRVLIGGTFTTVNDVGRNRIARLNTDGSVDSTFLNGLAGADNRVTTLALQADGRVLIGGDFLTVNGTTRQFIARLNANGSLDGAYGNGFLGSNDQVFALAVQPDGRALVGGGFTVINSFTRFYLARLNANGTVDGSFLGTVSGPNRPVFMFAVQPDGRILIGGSFDIINGVHRNFLARLYPDGTLDTSFLNGISGLNNSPAEIVLQPDGRILVVGGFTSVNGVSRNSIVRLNTDGSLDTTFLNGLPGLNSYTIGVALQPDGRVLAAGTHTLANGLALDHVVRLHGSVPVAPAIVSEPSSQSSFEGCCTQFGVEASGGPLDYQWRRDGVDLVDDSHLSGAHGPTLALAGVTSADNGAYSVVVSNLLGAELSADATLDLESLPACVAATCGSALDCVFLEVQDGASCSDGNDCSVGDSCAAGVCTGAPTPPPSAIGDSVRVDKTPTDATITWNDPPGAYNLYRGSNGSGLWLYNQTCLYAGLSGASTTDAVIPPPDELFYYLLSRVDTCNESDLGNSGSGTERPNTLQCQ